MERLRLAVSAEFFIRTGSHTAQACPLPQRRTVTVGGAKRHEHFRDLERSMHQGVVEAIERLHPGESMIGLGLDPVDPPGAGTPCRLAVTILDLPAESIGSLPTRTRALLPLICALAASSPFESNQTNGVASNALMHHIRSCIKEHRPYLPLERRFTYGRVEGTVSAALPRPVLALDSANGVVRASLWDAQECVRSNLAMVALLSSLVRVDSIGQDTSEAECEKALEQAARGGTSTLKEDLWRLFELAGESASPEERMFLPIIRDRIENGSLGETLPAMVAKDGMDKVMEGLSRAMRTNRPFLAPCPD